MDLYALLGLARGATLVEIKRSYRRLARKHHPDINPGDAAAEARFRAITRAYETLIDPDRRVRYDASGLVGEAAASVTVEFEGFDFSGGGGHVQPTFGDLFAEVFSRSARSILGPEAGADMHVSIAVTFDEAMQGVPRQVVLTRREACAACHGAGVVNAVEAPCRRCQGAGVLRHRRGHMVFSRPCEACEGVGRLATSTCMACAGLGVESRAETVRFRVPAGVADGARLRVPGKGHAGVRGGRPGDLYVSVDVESHELFRRDGDDLHLVVPVAIHEAALGARIEVPSPDGVARVRIPPGTQTGQRFRVRGRGAPSRRGEGERGDLVVEVRLVLPSVLDERSKELLREFGRLNDGDLRKQISGGQA